MAFQYTEVKDNSLLRGIDASSSDGEIQEGYCADAVNVDLDGNYISKRKGYEVLAGEIPLKVLNAVVSGTGTQVVLTFGSSFNFDNIVIDRVILYGRSTISASDPLIVYSTGIVGSSNTVTCTTLTGSTLIDSTDTTPELYLYGIPREDVTTTASKLTVNMLDKYVTTDESTLIAGIDGNIFKIADPSVTSYTGIITSIYLDQVIGPALWNTSDTVSRDNTYLKATDINGNLAKITSVAYNTSTGYVEYTISADTYQISGGGSLTDVFVAGWYVDIQDIMNDDFNGQFEIVTAIDDPSNIGKGIIVSVINSTIVNDDHDIAECDGRLGLFCDKFNYNLVDLAPIFAVNDSIFGDDIPDTSILTCISDEYTGLAYATIVVSGVVDEISLTNTNSLYATRTTDLIHFFSDNAGTTYQIPNGINIFNNDIITISNQQTSLEDGSLQERIDEVALLYPSVPYVIVDPGVGIVGDGTSAVITLGTPVRAETGDTIRIAGAGRFSGSYVVTEDNNVAGMSTELTVSSSVAGTFLGGVILCYCYKLGREVEINGLTSVGSANTVAKPYQWYPILPHNYSYGKHEEGEIDVTNPQHSVMANDSLFIAGSHDHPPRKFDGDNISIAGLPEIRSHLFCTVDESSTEKITVLTEREAIEFTEDGWGAICWSPELGIFCAVAHQGEGSRIMTSDDGVNWINRYASVNTSLNDVCWAAEIRTFCIVGGDDGSASDQVLLSKDGVSWTPATAAADKEWRSVAWSPTLNLFVAVATGGSATDQVMSSPDGVTWTLRTAANNNSWFSVRWGNGRFIAVAFTGATAAQGGMYSTNGITWTALNIQNSLGWTSLVYNSSLARWCTVRTVGAGTNRAATSDDNGNTWTLRTIATTDNYSSVTWGLYDTIPGGVFIAVSNSSSTSTQQVAISTDGITWSLNDAAAQNDWWGVTWSNELGIFCAVSDSGIGDRVMRSSNGIGWVSSASPIRGIYPNKISLSNDPSLSESDNFSIRITDLEGRVQYSRDIYTITEVQRDSANSIYTVIFTPSITTNLFTIGGAYTLIKNPYRYKYYTRLTLIDSNKNIISAPSYGKDDLSVTLGNSASVKIKGVVPHTLLKEHDKDGALIEIFRTKAFIKDNPEVLTVYYKVGTVKLSDKQYYWTFTDFTSDISLTQYDIDPLPTSGVRDIGVTRSSPKSAKTLTSINNRIVYGNLKDYPNRNFIISPTPEFEDTDLVDTEITITYDSNSLVFGHSSSNTLHIITNITVDVLNSTFTVLSSSTLPAVDDWVFIGFSLNNFKQDPTFCGWWRVDSISAGVSFTVNWSGVPSSVENSMITDLYYQLPAAGTGKVPIPTTRDTMNINGSLLYWYDIRLIQLYTLANAINSIMAQMDSSGIAGYTEPYLVANANTDYSVGFIELYAIGPNLSIQAKIAGGSNYELFVDGITAELDTNYSLLSKPYPNRAIISYQNFSEMFDNIRAVSAQDSLSVVDVDPSDGDEITAIIPFFSDSAFGAAQKTNILVVFKNYSIHIVDTEAKFNGESNYVKKIESRGLGCQAPFSPISTKYGIMFANKSGIFLLDTGLNITCISNNIERLWKDELLEPDYISLVAACNDKLNRKYLFSIPITDGTTNSDVLVYHDKDEGEGNTDGWTRYDNFPATIWANLADNTYFGSTEGLVYKRRNDGILADYRDNDTAINSEFVTKAQDYGVGETKKILRSITHYYKNNQDLDLNEMELQYAIDLDEEFSSTETYKVRGARENNPTSFGDIVRQKETGVMSAIRKHRFNHLQLKFSHNVLNKGFSLVRILMQIAGLRTRGTKEANQTKE